MNPASWCQLGYLAAGLTWMAVTHYRWYEQWDLMISIGPERWWRIAYTTAYVLTLTGWGLAWPLSAPAAAYARARRRRHAKARG